MGSNHPMEDDPKDALVSQLAVAIKEISRSPECQNSSKKMYNNLVRRVKLLSPLFEELKDSEEELGLEEIRGLFLFFEMASNSRALSTTALLLSLNLMIFTLVSSTDGPCPPPSKPPEEATCPVDTLNLGGCVDLLEGLLGLVVGGSTPQKTPCCSLIEGLDDLEAAVCLCTVIKASVFGGTNLDLPLSLSLLLNYCDKTVSSEFQCS
ncbi:pEARLI1-like lipid transfer protein 2 [Camellia lanceoleosa]|uniref:PEARLI1-like lipid transfer protein 2 n=1 Tax=Camellia lanceoleosa TaxID=1840588 RepID=A0ACC0J478_9ERIC|nr:pEARLI1-like lipid transfer protein 2 [Camellia lanceoleosa]